MHIIHPERCTSFDMKDAHHLHIETKIQQFNIKKEKFDSLY